MQIDLMLSLSPFSVCKWSIVKFRVWIVPTLFLKHDLQYRITEMALHILHQTVP